MKVSVDEVISNINEALAEADKPLKEIDKPEIQGVVADQLPPDVAKMEADLFEKMYDNFIHLNGNEPEPEIVDCIQFLAKAEAVRRHTYRKLAMRRLDDYLDSQAYSVN